jgi:uncharacterized membrane-anchored protein YhcB (DUF1043 family)
MNEKIKNILLHIVCFVVGVIIGGVGTIGYYTFLYKPDSKLSEQNRQLNIDLEQLREDNSKTIERNKELTKQLTEIKERFGQSIDSANTIDGINQDLSRDNRQVIIGLQELRSDLQSHIDTK